MKWTLLILLLLSFSTVYGPPLPDCLVRVEEGETVILPVKVDLPQDSKLLNPIIKWKTETGATVHQYWVDHDYNEYQIEHYKNRTSLFKKEIIKGNILLKIIKVNKRDEGIYTCQVLHEDPDIEETYKVSLCVTEKDKEPGRSVLVTFSGLLFGPFPVFIIFGCLVALISGVVYVIKKCKKCIKNKGQGAPGDNNMMETLRRRER